MIERLTKKEIANIKAHDIAQKSINHLDYPVLWAKRPELFDFSFVKSIDPNFCLISHVESVDTSLTCAIKQKLATVAR